MQGLPPRLPASIVISPPYSATGFRCPFPRFDMQQCYAAAANSSTISLNQIIRRVPMSLPSTGGPDLHDIDPPQKGVAPSSVRSLRSEEHTSELQSLTNLVCRLLLEKKKKSIATMRSNSD